LRPKARPAPNIYLRHLLSHRGLTVYDRRTGGIGFMTEETALAYIAQGKIQAMGDRRAIRELHWIGETRWEPIMIPEEAAGYKPSDGHPTEYSHDRETRDNPKNNWMLIRLPSSTRRLFVSVPNGCIATFFDPSAFGGFTLKYHVR
jgi:hypothetical protein